MVNDRFGTEFTYKKMRAFLKNHKLKTGMSKGIDKGSATKLYSSEVREYIHKNYIGCRYIEMAERLNKKFGTSYTQNQIRSYFKNHHLNSGLTGFFQKGLKPLNGIKKGDHLSVATEFKKGYVPKNHKPIGTVTRRADGYLYRKIAEPNKWEFLHRLIWEEKNGKIPEDNCLVFLDQNPKNCILENLALVSKQDRMNLIRKNLLCSDPDINKTGILIAQVMTKLHSRKREETNANTQKDRNQISRSAGHRHKGEKRTAPTHP